MVHPITCTRYFFLKVPVFWSFSFWVHQVKKELQEPGKLFLWLHQCIMSYTCHIVIWSIDLKVVSKISVRFSLAVNSNCATTLPINPNIAFLFRLHVSVRFLSFSLDFHLFLELYLSSSIFSFFVQPQQITVYSQRSQRPGKNSRFTHKWVYCVSSHLSFSGRPTTAG